MDGSDPGPQITLRDGRSAVIRPIAADDDERLAATQGFSERSLYLRFLGSPPKPTSPTITYLTDVDHRHHEALLALRPDNDELLGVARFVRVADDADTAEAAIIVADEWQRCGLGHALLERLAQRAREEGISHFEALLLAENDAVLGLLSALGDMRLDRSSPGMISVTIELADATAGSPGLLAALRAAAAGDVRLFGLDWRTVMVGIRRAWRLRPGERERAE